MEKLPVIEQDEDVADLISELEKGSNLEYRGETESGNYRFQNTDSKVFLNLSTEEIQKLVARKRRQEKLAA